MGTMTFQLPAKLPRDAARELEHSCMAGGPDNMPWPTEVHFGAGQMRVRRAVDESGYLAAPWPIEDAPSAPIRQLMGTSATLMERPTPYHLIVELARGKINQVRCQSADWEAGGLALPGPLSALIHDISLAFGHAVCSESVEEVNRLAQEALNRSYRAASELVEAYVQQVFQLRHQRQPRLESSLGCRLGPAVLDDAALGAALARGFNQFALPLSWHVVEAEEATYRWEQADELLNWALQRGLSVTAGPLVDFSSALLPAWLWLWERDLPSMATFMCRFVESAVRRYRNRIRRWHLTAGSNWANVLGLTEDELLGLTYRLGEAARSVDDRLELVVGIAQPWGEYMASADRTYSPFIFADNLIRSGINLVALDVEVIMGVRGRGSYCRDALELSRLLDLYALLGVPLRVTLAYPADHQDDSDADPEVRVGWGHWAGGFTPEAQASWASTFAPLALCKPFVQGVQWTHFADGDPHQFPHCGLIDRQGQPRPALQALTALREEHLK
jgi:hypothetical protein